jgi:hypothetical protein
VTDMDRMVVWLRETLDAEAELAQRVAARHTASHDEHVPEERRGKPFWPLHGARHRYEEFAEGKPWSDPNLYAGLTLIEAYNPQRVLRQIGHHRKILDLHTTPHTVVELAVEPVGELFCGECDGPCTHKGEAECEICGQNGCDTLRLLADGYGWKEGQQ